MADTVTSLREATEKIAYFESELVEALEKASGLQVKLTEASTNESSRHMEI